MARRIARTARQRAASRRNVLVAQKVSARTRRQKVKRAAIIGGVVVGAGAAAYGGNKAYRRVDMKRNVYLYHSTNKSSARGIRRSGFQGADKRHYDEMGTAGRVYFSQTKAGANYGQTMLRVKVKRSEFSKISKPDPLNGSMHDPKHGYVTIHERDLRRRRVATIGKAANLARGTDLVKAHLEEAKYDVKNAVYKRRRRR